MSSADASSQFYSKVLSMCSIRTIHQSVLFISPTSQLSLRSCLKHFFKLSMVHWILLCSSFSCCLPSNKLYNNSSVQPHILREAFCKQPNRQSRRLQYMRWHSNVFTHFHSKSSKVYSSSFSNHFLRQFKMSEAKSLEQFRNFVNGLSLSSQCYTRFVFAFEHSMFEYSSLMFTSVWF
jgi:hypothetical protein